METRMAMQSRQQLEGHTKDQISRMSGILGSKATKFKGRSPIQPKTRCVKEPLENATEATD